MPKTKIASFVFALATALCATTLTSTAHAGFIQAATIVSIRTFAPGSGTCSGTSGCVAVQFNYNVISSPNCSTLDSSMIFDLSTNKARAWLSMLTAAMLAGRGVNAVGTGACMTPSGGSATEVLTEVQLF